MKKFKEILKDIWRNYKVRLIIGVLGAIIFTYHKEEMGLLWYIISMSIVLGVYPIVIGYGIKEKLKKQK